VSFVFPILLMLPGAKPRGTLRVEGKQNFGQSLSVLLYLPLTQNYEKHFLLPIDDVQHPILVHDLITFASKAQVVVSVGS